MQRLLTAIWAYLKDWKNLRTHTIIGLVILSVGLFLPVKPIFRIIVLVCIVALNLLRMRFEKSRKKLRG